MKAIDTEYEFHRFRSRLEARWAVFFDSLRIKWVYEPEGFVSESGVRYLPDFLLPDVLWLVGDKVGNGCWIEIKPSRANPSEIEKARLLAKGTNKPVFILDDLHPLSISTGEEDFVFRGCYQYVMPDGDFDGGKAWGKCHKCGAMGIGLWGCVCNCEDWTVSAKHPRILAAYSAAMSARFEHGETPIIR